MLDEEREWDYEVTQLVRAVDGDTFDLQLQKRFDFGFHLEVTCAWKLRFRLLSIDAWEKNQAGGAAATAFATSWITEALAVPGSVLRGQTFKTDHFGRWLIDLYRTDGEVVHLYVEMLNRGFGKGGD